MAYKNGIVYSLSNRMGFNGSSIITTIGLRLKTCPKLAIQSKLMSNYLPYEYIRGLSIIERQKDRTSLTDKDILRIL